jgi:hypothetical protein
MARAGIETAYLAYHGILTGLQGKGRYLMIVKVVHAGIVQPFIARHYMSKIARNTRLALGR